MTKPKHVHSDSGPFTALFQILITYCQLQHSASSQSAVC